MREILFRGKRIDNGEWVEGCYAYSGENHYIVIRNDISNWSYTYQYIEVISETVGQFTGLCDKNGKKIFEGDIIRLTRTNMYAPSTSFNNKDLVSLHRVYWDKDEHSFYQEHFDVEEKRVIGRGNLIFNDERASKNIIEVIGNIYDNPELIGGDDE